MKRIREGLSLIAAAVLAAASAAFGAAKGNVVGLVNDSWGNPVQGVEIELRDSTGGVVGKAVTGGDGAYAIACVAPGQYTMRFDPNGTGRTTDIVAAPVTEEGLTVNWTVEGDKPALATAQAAGGACAAGADGTGAAAGTGAALGGTGVALGAAGAVVVGGTLGGLAASGALGGGSSKTSSQ